MKRLSVLIIAALVAPAARGNLGGLIIDDFSNPVPPRVFTINLTDPDPTLLESSDAGILGGERDVLVDVVGTPQLTSITGLLGDGQFVFNSILPGTMAVLQYDGIDLDGVGPALTNSEGLGGIDLTAYGSAFYLDLLSIDGGISNTTGVEIRVHGPASASVFADVIPDSAGSYRFTAPFSSFSDASVLSDVTSIEMEINPAGVPNVDFVLNEFAVPEPTTLLVLGLGGLGLLRKRRQT